MERLGQLRLYALQNAIARRAVALHCGTVTARNTNPFRDDASSASGRGLGLAEGLMSLISALA